MRMVSVLTLCLSLGTASAQEVSNTPFLGGGGATKCAKWTQERQDAKSVLAFGLTGWILGFVSGVLQEDEIVLAKLKDEDVLVRIDFYCREHSDDVLYQASLVTAADLQDAHADQILRTLKDK
jgi:hypothetical protein